MQLREVLDFFTQFLVMMTCIKILGFGKVFTCALIAVYAASIILMIVVEDEE